MTQKDFFNVCEECVTMLRLYAPKDTGNLAFNAIKYEFIGNDTCKIYVDESIAPYMPFTNEPWESPRWNGKKNPNEKWFDNATEKIAEYLARRLKGELVKK